MEVNLHITEPMLIAVYIVGGILVYSIFGGIAAGIAARYEMDSNHLKRRTLPPIGDRVVLENGLTFKIEAIICHGENDET